MTATYTVDPMTMDEVIALFVRMEGSSEWAWDRLNRVLDAYTRLDVEDKEHYTREGYQALCRLAAVV